MSIAPRWNEGHTLEELSALTRENFEFYVGVATPIEDLPIIFRKDRKEIDEWCRQEFGFGLDNAYAWMLNMAVGQYKGVLNALAVTGHKTAMATINEVVLKMKKDDVQKVRIVSDVDEQDD